MKRHEVYSKFKDIDGDPVYLSMDELQDIGDPIDGNGEDMELFDDEVYIVENGEYVVLKH